MSSIFNNYQDIQQYQGNLFFLVDEVNSTNSYGYTNNKSQIIFNLEMLCDLKIIDEKDYESKLLNSKEGLTAVFPMGRYIVILKMKKNKKSMEMLFFDFRIPYADIDKSLSSIFSKKLITEFKRIKYYMEDGFDESRDNVELYC